MRNPLTATVALVTLAALLQACAPSVYSQKSENSGVKKAAPVVYISGFLSDYSQLKPSPIHEGTWYEMSKSLKGYTGLIIENPVMHEHAYTSEGPDPATTLALTEKLRSEMVNTLGQQFSITGQPGPRVAVLRMAITQVARSRSQDLRTRRIGGAAGELEIVDSRSGARLFAAVEEDYAADPYANQAQDPYHDAKATFIHWSSRMLRAVRNIDTLATRP